MKSNQQITIELPNLQTEVTLPSRLAQVLQAIINSKKEGISSLELSELGCISSPSIVSKLKSLGARIQSVRKDAVDASGVVRKAVAYYTYRGWN